ncbi:MAG: PEGA domain-containing protein [Candidatus Sulfotelmatobacter sp.]
MKTALIVLLFALLMSSAQLNAQADSTQPSAAPAPPQSQQPPVSDSATPAAPAAPKGFVLEDSTPVRLRINRTVSSGDAHVGDTIDFEVLEDVSLKGTLVIPKGGLAFATVTEAQAKRRMARGGKLDINIDYVKLIDDQKAALRSVKDMKGGGHTGAMVGGMVATSLVFFPAAPFFLFMHGKDISIPKGTEITAYVNGDMKLDIAKFQPKVPDVQEASGNSSPNVTSAKLQLDSDPSGADIQLDGSFVGNTPSDVQVPEGSHTITVKKAGFKDWERTLKVSAGSDVHLSAQLEKTE